MRKPTNQGAADEETHQSGSGGRGNPPIREQHSMISISNLTICEKMCGSAPTTRRCSGVDQNQSLQKIIIM